MSSEYFYYFWLLAGFTSNLPSAELSIKKIYNIKCYILKKCDNYQTYKIFIVRFDY